jgi:hypothetical protein
MLKPHILKEKSQSPDILKQPILLGWYWAAAPKDSLSL